MSDKIRLFTAFDGTPKGFYIVRDDGKFYRRRVSVVFGSPVLAKVFATAEEATRELALINPPALRRRCKVLCFDLTKGDKKDIKAIKDIRDIRDDEDEENTEAVFRRGVAERRKG